MQAKNAVGFNMPGAASSAADFGRVLGGFWEAKNLDFRTFFVIFSKQILDDVLEGQKIEKKTVKTKNTAIFRPAGRNVRGPGER